MAEDYCNPPPCNPDDCRLEAVTVCVNFADFLDVTLDINHPQLDHMIVVTTHEDKKTHAVARKHGATLVMTDLFSKNNRKFNKGAAINAGFGRFQYHGWRMHLDCDIFLPDNFRRVMFNHTHLDKNVLYGADRINIRGKREARKIANEHTQNRYSYWVHAECEKPIEHRYVDTLHGYVPLGFFQLWNADCQKEYPYSLGTAAHDDVMFAAQWPASHRRHLPTGIVYHLLSGDTFLGQNWDGNRRSPELGDF